MGESAESLQKRHDDTFAGPIRTCPPSFPQPGKKKKKNDEEEEEEGGWIAGMLSFTCFTPHKVETDISLMPGSHDGV